MEAILQDWEDFAKSIQPKYGNMSVLALRDDTKQVMEEIADELETWQSTNEQTEKLWDEIVPEKHIEFFDLIGFNEAIDQRVHEAIVSFTAEAEMQTRRVDTVLSFSPDHNYILGREECLFKNGWIGGEGLDFSLDLLAHYAEQLKLVERTVKKNRYVNT